MQVKLKKKFECYKEKEGTNHKMESEDDKANQSRAEECDLKIMIQKYGILPFEMANKASENLYLDMRGTDLTINEAYKQRMKINEYFEQLPAKIRKQYQDNKEIFYQNLMSGNFEQMIEQNIMTQEQADKYTQQLNKNQTIINNLQAQIDKLKGELTSGNQNKNMD